MKSNRFTKPFKWIFFISSGILFFYVFSRAFLLSFTHDESISYSIIEGNTLWIKSANNHLLNTELMRLFRSIFGQSELSLRLPNVLSFIVYMTGCYFILRRFRNIWVSVFGLLLLLNPFLIEFFSLARGYGLSMGFLLISLHFLTRQVDESIQSKGFLKNFIWSLIFATLGVYANLALINYYICVIIIFLYRYLWHLKFFRKNIVQHILYWGVFLISLIPLFLAVKRLLLLKETGQIYFGSNKLSKSLQSIVESSVPNGEIAHIAYMTIVITLILFLIVGVIYIIYAKSYNSPLFHIILLILFVSAGLIGEHIIFDANYPHSRTALFYIPILSVYFYHLLSKLLDSFTFDKRLYIPLISIFCLILFTNFLVKANFSHTTSWRYDAQTKTAIQKIREQTQNSSNQYTISNHWLFTPTINFYIDIWDLNVYPSNRNGVDRSTDFIYRLNDTTILKGFKEISRFEEINSQLLIKEGLSTN